MEVFGVIVLLVITLIAQIGGIEAFLVAATATVACGFVGDLMNDFKAGHILKTSPKAQWLGVTIGGLVGAVVGTAIIGLMVTAYVRTALVWTRNSLQRRRLRCLDGWRNPHLPAFIIGVVLARYSTWSRLGHHLGLGIYLPFYLSLTVAVAP
jgi:uncharacterized oligopeptide transporter (OPT) family protein